MKDKLKPLIKEAKKTARKAIEQSLITQLKEITVKFGEPSKKLDKKIEKEAKKLAKKFANNVKVDKTILAKTDDKPKAVPAPKTAAAPKATVTKAKTAAKKPVAKIAAS